ncbi:MAG TPA: 50S ribosomal protein L10 [Mycobacteriales bacterium]|nr:50S ribosomal protein L10 [Mycobacteriales bacterium]
MGRPDKTAAVAEIADAFRESSAAVLTEYRGLRVKELTELRSALGVDVRYAVVKNTLSKIAAREAGLADLEALLEGPTAIAFIKGDPVDAAKGIRDFAKTHPLLVVKGGVMEGKTLSPDDVTKIASLESREVLLAKLAGAMQATMAQALYAFTALPVKAAQLAEALRQKAEADPSILRGGAGTPAPAEVAVDADAPADAEAPADATAEAPAEAPTDTPADAPADATDEAPPAAGTTETEA